MIASSTARRRVAAAASFTALALLGTATAASAHSAQPAKKKPKPPPPPTFLTVVYTATGTSHIAKPNSDVTLGPTTLTATLNNQTDEFTGSLPLPPTTASFKVLGLLPVTATVSFIPNGPVTGKLVPAQPFGTTAQAQSSYTLQLSNVTLAGIPTSVGSTCQTASPVEIDVASPAGQLFNPFTGGTFVGTYTVGDFANCGLTTSLINQLVPGPGNTATFTASDGQLQH